MEFFPPLGRVLPRALVSLLCLPLLFGDTVADVLLFVDSNYGTLCENSSTIIILFLRFISLFSLVGGAVGARWASWYFSLLIGDTFAHVKNQPKISSTFWCFLTFSVCPWKSGSSKEPYDFTVPSSLSTWQIHFSCVLLCADMNCGTLFEKSSTNIIQFFPSSSFLCVFIFWVSGNGLCDFSVQSLRILWSYLC